MGGYSQRQIVIASWWVRSKEKLSYYLQLEPKRKELPNQDGNQIDWALASAQNYILKKKVVLELNGVDGNNTGKGRWSLSKQEVAKRSYILLG